MYDQKEAPTFLRFFCKWPAGIGICIIGVGPDMYGRTVMDGFFAALAADSAVTGAGNPRGIRAGPPPGLKGIIRLGVPIDPGIGPPGIIRFPGLPFRPIDIKFA